jgi:eukaryotic-like serine/threonine-protein kinase
MAKVFTITEGLENMGALKTGGQGSVYKGRRIGEIVTAVKLLPTPIHTESAEDRHFLDFQNEVNKLKKVNEKPNPNVVKILSSGITETGSFPFIEMEFIEGPELEELLKPPHFPVFTIKEAIRVAEDLSNALAHCHRVDVKHGDIKTNNIKYNIHSAHYVLLDFGMAVMSDEQRRTSLRQAGAIEFMAPEQNEGEMLFQTDIYSFGIVMYELLAGIVPFPLKDRGETARNTVMVSHMEAPVPDLLALRKEHLPEEWSEERKHEEMQVPAWLVKTIYRCLEKNPKHRFANGIELNSQVVFHRVSSFADHDMAAKALGSIQKENERLRNENKDLEQRLSASGKNVHPSKTGGQKWNRILLILVFVLAGALSYFLLNNKERSEAELASDDNQPVTPRTALGQFQVIASRAYFHNEPDVSTRRKAFMIPSNDLVTGLDEKNGFVYTEFTNSRGQTSKGWLKLTDLRKVQPGQESSVVALPANSEDINLQLQDAETLMVNNNIEQATFIYERLAGQENAEAMYHYGNLGLKRKINIDCEASLNWVRRSSDKGHPEAKRTLGFLYIFADNQDILRSNEYDQCSYERNVFRGTQLLREASASGDSVAARILDQLNL